MLDKTVNKKDCVISLVMQWFNFSGTLVIQRELSQKWLQNYILWKKQSHVLGFGTFFVKKITQTKTCVITANIALKLSIRSFFDTWESTGIFDLDEAYITRCSKIRVPFLRSKYILSVCTLYLLFNVATSLPIHYPYLWWTNYYIVISLNPLIKGKCNENRYGKHVRENNPTGTKKMSLIFENNRKTYSLWSCWIENNLVRLHVSDLVLYSKAALECNYVLVMTLVSH